MTGPTMESFGEVLWNGVIAKGGTLAIPRANEYGVMAVSYAGHAPVGLAMHFVSVSGLHMIEGIAGAAQTNGLVTRGFDLRSDDGVQWKANDLCAISQWGASGKIDGAWDSASTAKSMTIWGVVPSRVTQRVLVE